MKRIKCFIAGSKEQERQREIIEGVLGKMHSKWDVAFEIKSFNDFDGRLSVDGQQKDYNYYITKEANLVIFIFDKGVGEKTVEEFVEAYKSMLTDKHPDILVFCNKNIINDPQIETLKLMMNQLNNYYIEYKSDIELKMLFKDEMERYVEAVKESPKSKKEKPVKSRKSSHNGRRYVAWACMTIACLLMGVGAYLLAEKYLMKREPFILAAGGGSALNFIEMKKGISINNYDNGSYLHLPSGSAWGLMGEEAITEQLKNNNEELDELRKGREDRKYYPICLSADSASQEKILGEGRKAEEFLKKCVMVGIFMGYDTLQVQATRSVPTDNINGRLTHNKLPISLLRDLLADTDTNDLRALTTSKGSGTLQKYEKELRKVGFDLDSRHPGHFAENDAEASLKEKNRNFIVMGSVYYHSNALEGYEPTGKTYRWEVTDDKGYPILKPIFVYFMAYNPQDYKYTIPEETLRFLKYIGVELKGTLAKGYVKVPDPKKVIYYEDEISK